MSNVPIEVGDYDVSRADTTLRLSGTHVWTDADALGDEAEVVSGSFGQDVDLLGIDWRIEFRLSAVHETGAGPTGNLNVAAASAALNTLGSYARGDEPGVYWNDLHEEFEPMVMEDDTNQNAMGLQGAGVTNIRWLLAIPEAVAQVDTSPDAGQGLAVHTQLNAVPGAGNYAVGTEVVFFARAR